MIKEIVSVRYAIFVLLVIYEKLYFVTVYINQLQIFYCLFERICQMQTVLKTTSQAWISTDVAKMLKILCNLNIDQKTQSRS